MAKCWTCGSPVQNWQYKCPSCKGLKEIKSLQKKVKSFEGNVYDKLDFLALAQQEGYLMLKDELTEGVSEIASIFEWGFVELSWQLQQQTNTLRSIDNTLKTPGETQANEWRKMAEELILREVLDEAEEFYLKSLQINRLDYRIYIGLAVTYLQMNGFDRAKYYLEKSLPHAPKEEIDYRSFSYRLMGRIFACEENYSQAATTLYSSIELSPNYTDAYYDFAQYTAQLKDVEPCLSSLQKAILAKPVYFYLAQQERNFNPVKDDVQNLLTQISEEAIQEAKEAISNTEATLALTRQAVSEAEEAFKRAKGKGRFKIDTYEKAKSKLKEAKDKLALKDYIESLDAKLLTEHSKELTEKAKEEAQSSTKYWNNIHEEKVTNAWKKVPLAFIVTPLIFGIIFGVGGCVVGLFSRSAGKFLDIGFILGIIIGVIIGAFEIAKELR